MYYVTLHMNNIQIFKTFLNIIIMLFIILELVTGDLFNFISMLRNIYFKVILK